MKTRNYFNLTFAAAIAFAFVFSLSSCKKEEDSKTTTPAVTVPQNTKSGLGSTPGRPTGIHYSLPSNIHVVGKIYGGMHEDKSGGFDKKSAFPYDQVPKDWTYYGTGTIAVYLKLYNSSSFTATVPIPGGLIFGDCIATDTSSGKYQGGLILQTVNVYIPAFDTIQVVLCAYCLNFCLTTSYYAEYYIGPITNNPDLSQVVSIMVPKQYPYGEEYDIQDIIWNVTDYGLSLTQDEKDYLNSLP